MVRVFKDGINYSKGCRALGFGLWTLAYDLILTGVFLFYLPVYFLRKKTTFFSLKERLGFFPVIFSKSIWIHAVSVGEVNLIEPVVNKVAEIFNYPILISTTTLTGNRLAKRKYAKTAKVIYSPLDLSFAVKRFLKKVNPKIVIAAETELWPNLILHLKQKGIPFLIINGRISNQAFRKYKLIRPLMKKIFSGCSHIGAQTKNYKKRFISLGAKPSRVSVTGNLKFNSINPEREKINWVKKQYSPILKPGSKELFIAASTHSPEEKIILSIYKEPDLNQKLSLLIAPRHPQRINSIEKIVLAEGFNPVRISRLSSPAGGKKDVFILDTIGQLLYFYSICDICFVGGSLSGYGGHNILEPLYFLKPVIFGPSMENFSEIRKVVIDNSAGIQVNSPKELKEKLRVLSNDKSKRSCYAQAAVDVFKNYDSLDKNLKIILKEANR